MNIESITRPNLISDPDVVRVVNTENATREAILEFACNDDRVLAHRYFGTRVRLWEDDQTADVYFYKD